MSRKHRQRNKRQIKKWYEAEDYLTNHKPVPKSKYYMEILEILILWFPTTWFWAPEFPPRHLDLTMSSCQECMDMHQDLGSTGYQADFSWEFLRIYTQKFLTYQAWPLFRIKSAFPKHHGIHGIPMLIFGTSKKSLWRSQNCLGE